MKLIYMGVFINTKEVFSQEIGQVSKNAKHLKFKSKEDETIDELAVLFYKNPIRTTHLTLRLCKDEGKLYFKHENNRVEIEVIEAKENGNENKNENENFKSDEYKQLFSAREILEPFFEGFKGVVNFIQNIVF